MGGLIGILLLIIFVITAILLIILVLMQDEQGEGLGGLFGGGSATPFGSRSGNVLTRATSILGAIFMVCSLGLLWVNVSSNKGDLESVARQSVVEEADTEWWNTPVDAEEASSE